MAAFFHSLATSLAQAQPALVLAAVALYAVSVALAAARWRLLLNAMAGPVRLVDVVLANLGGICANNLTISSRLAGEAARIALIRVRSRVPVPEATAAVVLERLSELPPIAILIVLAFPALAVVNGGTMLVMGIALTALVAIIALTTPRWNQPLRAWWARRFGRDRTLLVPRATMMAAVGWSSLVWLQDVMRLWLVARALRVGLTIPQAATLSLLTMVAGWAPTFGGLGAIEGGLVGGLMLFGVPFNTAAAITAVERCISYVLATSAGVVAIVYVGAWRWTRESWQTLPDQTIGRQRKNQTANTA